MRPPMTLGAFTTSATAPLWPPGAGAGASTGGSEATTGALAAAELRAALESQAGTRLAKARRKGGEEASRCSLGGCSAVYLCGRFGACTGNAAVAGPSLFAGLGAVPSTPSLRPAGSLI